MQLFGCFNGVFFLILPSSLISFSLSFCPFHSLSPFFLPFPSLSFLFFSHLISNFVCRHRENKSQEQYRIIIFSLCSSLSLSLSIPLSLPPFMSAFDDVAWFIMTSRMMKMPNTMTKAMMKYGNSTHTRINLTGSISKSSRIGGIGGIWSIKNAFFYNL